MFCCKKEISPRRRLFRRVLVVLLVPCFLFWALASYVYSYTLIDKQKLKEISPTLFNIDIAMDQLEYAFESDNHKRYFILTKLCHKGLYASSYLKACIDMRTQLAQDGYAPAQTDHASYLMEYGTETGHYYQALQLYRLAAKQNYTPAQHKLALFDHVE